MDVCIRGSGGVMNAVADGCPYGIGSSSSRLRRKDCTATIEILDTSPEMPSGKILLLAFIRSGNYGLRQRVAFCAAFALGESSGPSRDDCHSARIMPVRRMDA